MYSSIHHVLPTRPALLGKSFIKFPVLPCTEPLTEEVWVPACQPTPLIPIHRPTNDEYSIRLHAAALKASDETLKHLSAVPARLMEFR